jgi:hypothetical protein
MHLKLLGLFAAGAFAFSALADEITTLDGQTYHDVRNIILKPKGLYFVTGDINDAKSVTVPYANLSEEIKDKYHCDPFEIALKVARRDEAMTLTKNMAFSLSQLEEAKKKAKAEKKLLGFIMVWDSFFQTSQPMGHYSDDALAHFYDVFHDNLVLVFVSHERELGQVPEAVRQGFFGPEEGGFAPNMAVVTADCSKFVCEIPYGGAQSNGQIREKIFRDKIAVIKSFLKGQPDR